MGLGQLLFDFTIVVNLSFLGVNQQNLSWLQTTFAHYVARLKVHDTNLRGYHHHTTLGNGITTGAQTVSVQHTACIATIAKQQCSWSVPRFHQDRVILVESLQVFADGVLVVETLRYQNSHRLWQRESTHHQELKYVVKTGRVAHTLLYYWAQVFDITQRLTVQHTLASLHPTTIATNGVDLTIVG